MSGRTVSAKRPAVSAVDHKTHTEWMAATNWPPGFVSAIRVDPKTKRFETDYARTQRIRLGGGWDSHPCLQPGSATYVQSGPVQMMGKP
jgi:hypothetical protein